MNTDARNKLNCLLQSKACQCIAVTGEQDSCNAGVLEVCHELQLECVRFLNVPSMASLERIHGCQRANTVICEGHAQKPTFIRSFLAANGFMQMPKVLVLTGFNSVPKETTYFLRELLDVRSRENDECYDQLAAIVLIFAPVDAPGSFDIDPDIRGCIAALVNTGS